MCGGSASHAFPALHTTSAAFRLAWFPPRSVTCGTLPGVGGTLPSPRWFLPAARPLLPAAARTLPTVVQLPLGLRAHGPRARDSVAVATTHGGHLAAPRLQPEVSRWQGLL